MFDIRYHVVRLTECQCSGSGGGGERSGGVVTRAATVDHASLHRLEIVFIAWKCEKYLHQLSSRVDESIKGVERPGSTQDYSTPSIGIVFHELLVGNNCWCKVKTVIFSCYTYRAPAL